MLLSARDIIVFSTRHSWQVWVSFEYGSCIFNDRPSQCVWGCSCFSIPIQSSTVGFVFMFKGCFVGIVPFFEAGCRKSNVFCWFLSSCHLAFVDYAFCQALSTQDTAVSSVPTVASILSWGVSCPCYLLAMARYYIGHARHAAITHFDSTSIELFVELYTTCIYFNIICVFQFF